nr:hypothetical protein CFP56_56555 [Quercus suber]
MPDPETNLRNYLDAYWAIKEWAAATSDFVIMKLLVQKLEPCHQLEKIQNACDKIADLRDLPAYYHKLLCRTITSLMDEGHLSRHDQLLDRIKESIPHLASNFLFPRLNPKDTFDDFREWLETRRLHQLLA